MTQHKLAPDQLDLTTVLPLAGGTLTGPLTLNADPASALQAATKQYVDTHAGSGGGSGSTLVDARLTFGAVIDGTPTTGTDNLTVLNAGLATPHVEVFVENLGADLIVSSVPTNVYGPSIGPGRVILPTTTPFPGHIQLNTRVDDRVNVFGQEYLTAFLNKLTLRTGCSILFSGDSTTAGDSLVHTYDQIHSVVQQIIRDHGFEVLTTNAGHSGVNTEVYRTTYLADDMAANPDLIVLRWGINDPGYTKADATVGGTTNAYDAEYATRRDITDYATSIRAILTSIRASKSVSQASILLMTPNSTSDSPNGRDEKWYEQVSRVLRKAARDFQCAFIDTYALWHDSRTAAGIWMDNPFGDGRAIHPGDNMNAWIGSVIADFLVPTGFRLRNVGSTFQIPAINYPPHQYPIGYSTFRVFTWTINGVSIDGMVVTFRSADGVCYQQVIDYKTQKRVAERTGGIPAGDATAADTWYDWLTMPTNTGFLTLQNGWQSSTRGITVDKVGGIVHLRGRISNGTATTGTTICTLPAGCVPLFDEYRPVMCGPGLASFGSVIVSSDGTLKCGNISDNTFIDVGSVSYSTF